MDKSSMHLTFVVHLFDIFFNIQAKQIKIVDVFSIIWIGSAFKFESYYNLIGYS